jgi:hypothetical protein
MSENINDVLDLKSDSETALENNQGTANQTTADSYPALKAIASIYRILAILAAIAAIITLFYGVSLLGKNLPLMQASGTEVIIKALIFGIFGTITCLAISEGIRLFINLESNSRKQVELLTQLVDKK